MQDYKKIFVLLGFLVFIITGIAATCPPQDDDHYTNLKVLPKKISKDQMERAMYIFERQLGVTCVYCHATAKNVFPERMDFASDEKPEKKIAREMLKMTLKINKKYFNIESTRDAIEKPKMWCKTCHRGFPIPPGIK
jgi:photosynthetic reaction center cytochrome c subunit